MTRIHNGEHGFREELLTGLTSAYARYLRQVPGASAVMAIDAPTPGQVSVITGGGSGHYPAFAGLVGPGLCHGAVVGEVFSSPSAAQALRTIRALDGGAGVLLTFGNYSGDVMHFGLAAEQARADGIDVRVVLVTDDIVSAPAERADQRRGIAGGFFVFRSAAAAARGGASLDEVERIARRVNERTRTFGVAFAGCTFPGRSEPLFRVEPGTIALGLGIHGEPGIETVPWMPAVDLADALLERVLAERPADGRRAAVLLNGLGSTKYEELLVLYGSVHRRLLEAGVEIVTPEVGEFVTSLDMAGCSLTLCWLDDEMERLLATPAAAAGYRMGTATWERRPAPPMPEVIAHPDATAPTPSARAVSRALDGAARAVAAVEVELGRLDSVAGDGDHGAGMARGMAAAATAARTGETASAALVAAGNAFADAAGGASGALWGAGLIAMGRVLAGMPEPPDSSLVVAALREARDVVRRLGGAEVGDKTLVDALVPFVDGFPDAGNSVPDAWQSALPYAEAAAQATASIAGRRGRAAVHGTHSIGTVDPGARSLVIILAAIGTSLRHSCGGTDG